MRHVRLANPVDIAINVFDGIDCLLTNDDLVSHFRAIAASLTPGGLYFIDLTHPRDCFFAYDRDWRYKGERDGVSVEIVWAVNRPVMNPVDHTYHTAIEMHINDHGNQFIIPDESNERLLSAQEITLLAALSGALQPVAWYGGYDIHQPFDMSPGSKKMIAVLQKS
jgi:hypothetical protein